MHLHCIDENYCGMKIQEKTFLLVQSHSVNWLFLLNQFSVFIMIKYIPNDCPVPSIAMKIAKSKLYNVEGILILNGEHSVFQRTAQFLRMNSFVPNRRQEKSLGSHAYRPQKYNVLNRATVCVRFLKDILSAENIFIGLAQDTLYEQKELLKFCEVVMPFSTVEFFPND